MILTTSVVNLRLLPHCRLQTKHQTTICLVECATQVLLQFTQFNTMTASVERYLTGVTLQGKFVSYFTIPEIWKIPTKLIEKRYGHE